MAGADLHDLPPRVGASTRTDGFIMSTTLNTERVHRLRSALGITQSDLAKTLGVPASTVARLEGGRLEADEATLGVIAKLLACTPEALTTQPLDVLYTRPWLRTYADAPKKTVDQYMSDTLVVVEVIEALKLRRMPDRLPTFEGDANNDHDIDEFAADVRHAADINGDTGAPT